MAGERVCTFVSVRPGTGSTASTRLDFIATDAPTWINPSTNTSPAKTVDVGFDGCMVPQVGREFAWALDDTAIGDTRSDHTAKMSIR